MKPGNGKPHFHPSRFSGPRGRVLLLNDDENSLQRCTALLERMAYMVRAFAKYHDAKRCLDHELFDIIVVSPAFEAHHLIELTLARRGHTPEVVLTRCLEMNCCVAAIQLGALHDLEKTLTPVEFEHLITHCQPGHGGSSARASEELDARGGVRPSHLLAPAA
jgi:DNA-binding NtrC family response regulator